MDSTLSQMNPFHTLISSFLKINFDIIINLIQDRQNDSS
jgi:hypothetical protein